jgi:hypothetical protein
MGYQRVQEENHNKAEKKTSKQMTCEVAKYNINSIIINNNNHSVIYYLCAESTATMPITDTAQCRYT